MTKIEITQQLVQDLFHYNNGKLYWKKPGSRRTVGKEAGTMQKYSTGGDRMRVGFNGVKYLSARIVFLYHKGYLPNIVDHEDNNQLNDYIENLRDADCEKNARNRSPQKKSTSKYLGVHFTTMNNKSRWRAQIGGGGIGKTHLGLFYKEEEAALAYNREAVKRYGEFANLNIISEAQSITLEDLNKII